MNRRVIFRVDASSEIGFGHFRRCVNLSEVLKTAGFELFLMTNKTNPLIKTINLFMFDEIILLEDSQKLDVKLLIDLTKKVSATWVVLDGYNFNEDYEKKIKDSQVKLFRIDDLPRKKYSADVLLNQNYGSEKWDFQIEAGTKLALGLKYLLISREFKNINVQMPNVSSRRPLKILITLGGAVHYYEHFLNKLVESIRQRKALEFQFTFVIPEEKVKEKISEIIKIHNLPVTILAFSNQMPELILESDYVLTSPGTTMWELVYLVKPFGVVPLTAEHEDYCKILHNDKICTVLSRVDEIQSKEVTELFDRLILDVGYRESFVKKLYGLISRNQMDSELVKLFN